MSCLRSTPPGSPLNIDRVTPAVTLALLVSAFGSAAQGLLAIADMVALSRGGNAEPAYLLLTDWRASVDGFATGAWLVAAAVFLGWVVRANASARRLGATDMEFSPAASAGWFLVPVANLFVPYAVMKEIWSASQPGQGSWKERRPSPVLAWWWGMWLIAFGLAWWAGDASLTAYTVEQAIEADAYLLAACVADIVTTALLLYLVRDIERGQEQLARGAAELPRMTVAS